MQAVRAFAEALERFSRSKALLGQVDLAHPSSSLIVEVRRLILKGAAAKVAMLQGVAGVEGAMRMLADLHRGEIGKNRHPLTWGAQFHLLAQHILRNIDAAETAQRVGDPEATRALAEVLARQPGKIKHEEMEKAVTAALGRTLAPAVSNRLWETVPHDRKHAGRPPKPRTTPTPEP